MADAIDKRFRVLLPVHRPSPLPSFSTCPQCGCEGCVAVSAFILLGERHVNRHCGCCGYVAVERDRRESRQS